MMAVEHLASEFLTIAEAANFVRVSVTTVRSWCHSGRLRRYGEGRIWRIRKDELLSFMAGGPSESQSSSAATITDIMTRLR